MMRYDEPRFLIAGDSALIVELGSTVDEEINRAVVALDRALAEAAIEGVFEVVPTYRSLMVSYEPEVIATQALIERLRVMWPLDGGSLASRRWVVPVAYGGEFGEDLEAVAAAHGMSTERVVALHTAPEYRVYMIGFMPGFTYLGGLDPALHTPRRTSPRTRTPAGSISIGGVQTAVSSVQAPSGWHLLGRTPERVYDKRRDPPFLLRPGDRIRFEVVDPRTWCTLAARVEAGETVARLVEEIR